MKYYLGWNKDHNDPRDLHIKHEQVKPFLLKTAIFGDEEGKEVPKRYLIGDHVILPEIKDQGQLGSCTANAAAYMYEAFLRLLQSSGEPAPDLQFNRLFIYKATRNLLHLTGDTGAYLRSVMKCLAMFGAPSEEFLPYDTAKFEEEPSAFLYAMAQSFQALTYYRLDPWSENDSEKVLNAIKVNISSNRAIIFGFVVYSNLDNSGDVWMPKLSSKQVGGHAVAGTGYDDNYKIGDEVGAIQFPNSWTKRWGHEGFGWIPYKYVVEGLLSDIWAMMKGEWMDLACFK